MKFLTFLNEKTTSKLEDFYKTLDNKDENKDIIKMLSTIYEECKPILKIYAKTENYCLRAVNGTSKNWFFEKVRTDRKPRFIGDELHKILGEFAKKYHGWNFREEGLFCGGYLTVYGFGSEEYIIFPKGEFEYVLINDIGKLYKLYDETFGLIRANATIGSEKNIQKLEEIYKNKYKKTGLEKTLKEKNGLFECVFKCDSYYAISNEWYSTILLDFLKFLKENKGLI